MRWVLAGLIATWLLAGCGMMLGYDDLSFSQDGPSHTAIGGKDAASDGVAGCIPQACNATSLQCGSAPDGCGGIIECGVCAAQAICGGAGPNQCGAKPCTPTTCSAEGAECDVISDGCAAALQCGTCPSSETCGGNGKPNKCAGSGSAGSGGGGGGSGGSGSSDPCAGLQSGWYCGGSSQHPAGDSATRYQCQSGATASSEKCANGCQVNASGTDDTCKVNDDPCAGLQSGWYCGGSSQHPGGDSASRYLCKSGTTSSSEKCANGCQVNASGTDDTCKASSSDGCSGLASGWYCGSSTQHPSGAANTRYLCQGGTTSSSQACSNGCQVNPPGNDDTCK